MLVSTASLNPGTSREAGSFIGPSQPLDGAVSKSHTGHPVMTAVGD
jgi:hypothetical protein